jgi:hypothetical protein
MTTKLKALGLTVLVGVAAIAAFGALDASGDTGGHFTSDVENTTVVGKESGAFHRLHFKREGATNEEAVGCKTSSYHGSRVGVKTFTDIRINPEWKECVTTKAGSAEFDVIENGCFFIFKIGDTGTHHTVDLVCPNGKKVEIKHPNCTVEIPPQFLIGVVYKTEMLNNKHAITLEATVNDIKSEYHAGICVFLGTNHEYEMNGSVTVEGFEAGTQNQVNITATTTTP